MKFKDLNLANVYILRYTRMEDGGYQHCLTEEDFSRLQDELDEVLLPPTHPPHKEAQL